MYMYLWFYVCLSSFLLLLHIYLFGFWWLQVCLNKFSSVQLTQYLQSACSLHERKGCYFGSRFRVSSHSKFAYCNWLLWEHLPRLQPTFQSVVIRWCNHTRFFLPAVETKYGKVWSDVKLNGIGERVQSACCWVSRNNATCKMSFNAERQNNPIRSNALHRSNRVSAEKVTTGVLFVCSHKVQSDSTAIKQS